MGLAAPLDQIVGGRVEQHAGLGKRKHDGSQVLKIRGKSVDLLSAVSQHGWVVGLGLGGEGFTTLIDGSQLIG